MRWMTLLALLAPAVLMRPALAAEPVQCRSAEAQVGTSFPLVRAAKAVSGKRLTVLVLGAGSSALPGPDGAQKAYPARLKAALESGLPGVTITLALDVQARRTAEEMVRALPAALGKERPQLVIWQTGTVDAMHSVEADQFNQALEQGISMSRAAGADPVLMNAQYSPRTESMIALGTYADLMRRVAVQQEVPLFDRFAVMKMWADLGVFDFYAKTKKLDTAEHVHDCIGRLLGDLVIESIKQVGPPG